MKNNNLIIGAVVVGIIILAVGGFAILNQSGGDDSSSGKTEEIANADKNIMASENGRYVAYSNEVFAEKLNTDRILYFYANWCPTCRPVDKELLENSEKIPEDLTIIRINYNDTNTDQDEKDLAREYIITYQHTFVQVDKDGKEITRWSGGGLEEILENIK